MHSIEAMCKAGCTTRRGVRYWESEGLLGEVARSSGDTRQYTDAQLDTARIIAAAQFGNFSLEEITEMLKEYHDDSQVYDALTTRLSDQIRAAARLAENLPMPLAARPATMEYDL